VKGTNPYFNRLAFPISSRFQSYQVLGCHCSTLASPLPLQIPLTIPLTIFNVTQILVPSSVVVKALGYIILLDPEVKSIVCVYSSAYCEKDNCYLLWIAIITTVGKNIQSALGSRIWYLDKLVQEFKMDVKMNIQIPRVHTNSVIYK
jgi:hypothetical protein